MMLFEVKFVIIDRINELVLDLCRCLQHLKRAYDCFCEVQETYVHFVP